MLIIIWEVYSIWLAEFVELSVGKIPCECLLKSDRGKRYLLLKNIYVRKHRSNLCSAVVFPKEGCLFDLKTVVSQAVGILAQLQNI